MLLYQIPAVTNAAAAASGHNNNNGQQLEQLAVLEGVFDGQVRSVLWDPHGGDGGGEGEASASPNRTRLATVDESCIRVWSLDSISSGGAQRPQLAIQACCISSHTCAYIYLYAGANATKCTMI